MDDIIIEKFNLAEQYVDLSMNKPSISLLLAVEMAD
jgi:hypothetical protein